MGRKPKMELNLQQQIEEKEQELDKYNKKIKELKSQIKELKEQEKNQDKEKIYNLIKESGLNYEDVEHLILRN